MADTAELQAGAADADALEAFLLEKHARHLVCRENSDLVIEGYPRSANTFTVDMLNVLSPGLRIAHHTHTVENLRLGRMRGKPVLVLIRNPADAILSLRVLSGRPTKRCVDQYRRFYQAVLALDQFIAADFDEVTTNFSAIAAKLPLSIPTSADLAADTAKAHSMRQARADKAAPTRRKWTPEAERASLKAALRDEVLAAVTPELSELYNEIVRSQPRGESSAS